ncbi:hypothetical protein HDU93_009831 [Gonapodya sp. JEL0774]|nr:hypothetical protein HDU93_009831 [Gonapodya sp. JEL0774]
MTGPAITETHCPELKLVARGKVRDLYEIDDSSLLFVATDRISAFDVIMKNGIPGKGKVLTQLSVFWFSLLADVLPNHLIATDLAKMPPIVQKYKDQLEGRVMLVRKVKILPVEAIVRGYVAGMLSHLDPFAGVSPLLNHQGFLFFRFWRRDPGTICDIEIPSGLKESSKLPEALFTPSTKAELGQHDENIHPSKGDHITRLIDHARGPPHLLLSFTVATLVGAELAQKMSGAAVKLYGKARDYAAERGIIIADTKFEFGVDLEGELILADEVLTPGEESHDLVMDLQSLVVAVAPRRISSVPPPDSSRFWPRDKYEPGRSQDSFDKQYLRDYLEKIGFDKTHGIELPEDVVRNTLDKYVQAFKLLTGKEPVM